jgi:hypothetical protein
MCVACPHLYISISLFLLWHSHCPGSWLHSNLVVKCHAVMYAFAILFSIPCLAGTPALGYGINDTKVVVITIFL